MRRTMLTTTGILVLVGLCATGCVRHDRYDTLREANNSLKEQLVRTENNLGAAQAVAETKDKQLAQATANLAALKDLYGRLSGELDGIDRENQYLLGTVTGIQLGPLPVEVQQKLAALAAAYPDDMSFDAQNGMLRFGSDFTFSSGRAALKPTAVELISRVASILNSPEAAEFEIVIVGHTDNVQPSASAARYPTNWDLSAARAVSVAKALASDGVNAVRIQVSGYGEYRPLVANAERGTAENRRVEIYLQPMPDTWSWATGTVSEMTFTETVEVTEEPMK